METMAADLPGLYLTGSAYRGVGLPDCIQQGQNTAETVIAQVHELTGQRVNKLASDISGK